MDDNQPVSAGHPLTPGLVSSSPGVSSVFRVTTPTLVGRPTLDPESLSPSVDSCSSPTDPGQYCVRRHTDGLGGVYRWSMREGWGGL